MKFTFPAVGTILVCFLATTAYSGPVSVQSTATSAVNSGTISGFSTFADTGLLIVGYADFRSSTQTFTVEFDGTPMTAIPGSLETDTRLATQFFAIANPGANTGDIVVTSTGGTNFKNVVAYNVTGANSLSKISATTTTTNSNASGVSVNVSPTLPALLIDVLAADDTTNGSTDNTANSPQTEVLNVKLPAFPDRFSGSSYKNVFAGATSMGWDWGLDPPLLDNEGSAYSVLTILATVPEPSTLALAGFGLMGLSCCRRRRR